MNLSSLTATALGLCALSATASAQSFSYADFSSTAGLTQVLSTANPSNVMRVHEVGHAGGDNMGAVWYSNPVSVVTGFDTTFEFAISGAGSGDGMAFVIQNDITAGYSGMTGASSIGRHASAIGYGRFVNEPGSMSIENALVIEIDHYLNANAPAADPILDPDNNHISIHTGGAGETRHNEDHSIGRADSSTLGFTDLNNGTTHTMRIVYVPGTLEVYFNGNLVITTPYNFASGGTWIDSGTPVGGLNLIGGTSMYVGFTASSGGSSQNHDVLSWSFDSGAGSGGVAFCAPGSANSTGAPAVLTASQNPGVGSGIHLDVTGGVPGQLAYMLIGNEATPGISISNGQFCLVGPATAQFFRYNVAGTDMNSIGGFDASGAMINASGTSTTGFGFDVPSTIPSAIPLTIMAGDTWHFQSWYRDTPAGVGSSNFTNGLSVTF